jgi:hypothetical protein
LEYRNSPDLFVPYTDTAGEGCRTVKLGDRVEFEIVQGQKFSRHQTSFPPMTPIKLLGLGLGAMVRLVGHRPEAEPRTADI